jgi:hypothetical protein
MARHDCTSLRRGLLAGRIAPISADLCGRRRESRDEAPAVARDLLVIVNRAGRRPLADWSLRIYREMSNVDQLYQNRSQIIDHYALGPPRLFRHT